MKYIDPRWYTWYLQKSIAHHTTLIQCILILLINESQSLEAWKIQRNNPFWKRASLNEFSQNDSHCTEILKMCVVFQNLAEEWLSVAHSSTWKFWAKLLSHIFFDIFLCPCLAPLPFRFLSHSQCIYCHLNIQKSLSFNSPKIPFTLSISQIFKTHNDTVLIQMEINYVLF